MNWRRPAAVLVFLVLLVATQGAFTSVGEPTSPAWNDPVAVASVDSDAGRFGSVAVAAGPDGGTVAWTAERDGTWVVETASLRATGDGVRVGETRTVARSDDRLEAVDVASDGDRVALTWVRAEGKEVVYHRPGTDRTRVLATNGSQVDQPSVDLTADGAVVAWQSNDVGGSAVRLASVPADGQPTYATVGGPTGGEGSPVVAANGSDVAVVWLNASDSTVTVTTADVEGDLSVGESTVLGTARPGGGFGGATPIGVSGGRNDGTVRAAWTFGNTIRTAAVDLSDGTTTDPRDVGSGVRPAATGGADRWLATWLYRDTGSGMDVGYAMGGPDGTESGTFSALPSNANSPAVAFAPAPTVVWTERGGSVTLYASSHSGAERSAVASGYDRLSTTPGRFLFVALGAAVVGVVTTAILPWSVVALLGAFLLSSRIGTGLLAGVATAVTGPLGGPSDAGALRHRLREVPPLGFGLLYGLAQLVLAVWFVSSIETTRSLGFSDPLPIGVAALVTTVVLYRLLEMDSAWWFAGLSAVVLNAALWTTVLPQFF